MLDINTFFASFGTNSATVEHHPSQQDLLPLQQYLESKGAIAALDTENGESDEIIINALKKEMVHWNWEVVYTLEIDGTEYSVAHCETLNIWLVDLWQDGSEEIKNTWFIG